MAKVTRFEDLACWQKARDLVNAVYDVTKRGPLSRDYGLRDQLQRASVSTMSNIAEGFARYHRRDFIRFLDIAQSSAAEVKSLLYVVLDQEYEAVEIVERIQEMAEDTRRLTLGLLRYLDSTLKREEKQNGGKTREPVGEYEVTSEELEVPHPHVTLEHLNTRTPKHSNTQTLEPSNT